MKTLALIAALAFSGTAYATTNSTTHSASGKSAVTASDQGKTQSDTDTTRSIRQRIHQDDSISTMGKNVTIITKDGMVTLKGSVSSTAEKSKINRIATDVTGKAVSDEMTVSR